MRIRYLLTSVVAAAAVVLAVTVAAGADGGSPAPAPSPRARDAAPTPSDAVVEAGGLRPGLEAAFSRARAAAAADGLDLPVSSGYRSAARQAELLEREVEKRGSLEEALHWVFRPEDSMHVRGLAIDIGSGPAADWLDRHGAQFGLCRTLAWEWWHFEWRERWEADGTCPPPATSPAEAPAE